MARFVAAVAVCALFVVAVASLPVDDALAASKEISFTPKGNPFSVQGISAQCDADSNALAANQQVNAAKAGTSATGCETCQTSSTSCTCTNTWTGMDAYNTACTNNAGKQCYVSTTVTVGGVAKTVNNILFLCIANSCSSDDIQAAAQQTVDTVYASMTKSGQSGSVSVTLCDKTATAAAAGLKASLAMVVALVAALTAFLRA